MSDRILIAQAVARGLTVGVCNLVAVAYRPNSPREATPRPTRRELDHIQQRGRL